jgi:putative hydrolase of the HAD superfamily
MTIKLILFDWFGVLYNFNINKEVFDIVFILKDKGYKIGVLSNMSNKDKEYLLNNMNLENLFDYFLTSSQLGYIKPRKEIFLKMLEEININPDECIFIDDSKSNVEVAKSLGIIGIHFNNSQKLIYDLLKNGADIR